MWTSPTEHHLVFATAGQQAHYDAVQAATARVHVYAGSETLTRQLSRSSKLFPPALLWLAAGLVGMFARRPAHAPTAAVGLLVLLFEALSDYAIVEFAVPLIPAFIAVGAVGLVGRRADARGLM